MKILLPYTNELFKKRMGKLIQVDKKWQKTVPFLSSRFESLKLSKLEPKIKKTTKAYTVINSGKIGRLQTITDNKTIFFLVL